MGTVRFEVVHSFAATPARVWETMVDWAGHGRWIPMTRVEVGPGDPHAVGATFTAWTGPGRLALEDRMRIASLTWDETVQRGKCSVDKLGPVLHGQASFTVTPGAGGGAEVAWVEDVTVRRLPGLLAPLVTKASAAGFRLAMRRLARVVAG